MDLVACCRAFVAVSGYGSFTVGAAAARIPQSVASRRIAALERHLDTRLFERSSRQVTLTPVGRELLPSARRLIDLAETLEHDAERARRQPFRLAIPEVCGPYPLAQLVAEGRRRGLHLDLHPGGPADRRELVRTLQVHAAVVAVPPDDGRWLVPLGLAGRDDSDGATIYLETLRAGRAGRNARRRRVWVQAEDDVPHVRDRLRRLADTVGLQPAQVVITTSFVAAAAEVLDSTDLLLCSPGQADALDLRWRPVGEAHLARGYDVAAGVGATAGRIRTDLGPALGRCLGAPTQPTGAAK